jgi:hypothetical protein
VAPDENQSFKKIFIPKTVHHRIKSKGKQKPCNKQEIYKSTFRIQIFVERKIMRVVKSKGSLVSGYVEELLLAR